MTTCGKCGAQRRRWPRRCARCRSGPDRADVAADAGEVAAELGAFGWIGRGIAGILRMLLRAVD
ncbi:hypothetical protein Sfulv_01790 [Streptomyces fulvorobeus]|uniref:Uncharacterized protein n=1 Tax=Streptomyces fulvorobeus TaxID=284028 RepID=A0A7J0BYQ9_9ACTN|nr:hypothetical protein Sfulv_01790 [Streptomyces fulvorobeus]